MEKTLLMTKTEDKEYIYYKSNFVNIIGFIVALTAVYLYVGIGAGVVGLLALYLSRKDKLIKEVNSIMIQASIEKRGFLSTYVKVSKKQIKDWKSMMKEYKVNTLEGLSELRQEIEEAEKK